MQAKPCTLLSQATNQGAFQVIADIKHKASYKNAGLIKCRPKGDEVDWSTGRVVGPRQWQ